MNHRASCRFPRVFARPSIEGVHAAIEPLEVRRLLSSTVIGSFGNVGGHNMKLVHVLADGTKETFSLNQHRDGFHKVGDD